MFYPFVNCAKAKRFLIVCFLIVSTLFFGCSKKPSTPDPIVVVTPPPSAESTPPWRTISKNVLFRSGDIVENAEKAEDKIEE